MFFTQEDYRKIEEYLRLNGYKDTDLPPLEREEIDIDNDIMTIVHNGKNYKISLQKLIAAYEWEKLDSVDSIEIVNGGVRWKDINNPDSGEEYFYSVNFDQLKEIVDSNKLVYLNFEDLKDHFPPNTFILLIKFLEDILVGLNMCPMYLGVHRVVAFGLTRGQDGEIVTQVYDVDFQEKLTSGTTIKTINSESLLGNGDINTKPAYINITSTTVNGQTSYTWDNTYYGLRDLINGGEEVIVVLNDVDVDGRLEKIFLYYDTETSPLKTSGESTKYTFTGTLHFGSTPLAVISITAGRGTGNNIATDVKVANFALAPEISLSYVSPLDEGGIAPGDTYEEAFHKLEEQINSMKDHSGGGDDGGDTPAPAALIYYGTSSTELSTGALIQGLHSSSSATVEDIYNGAYYYIAVHSSKQLKSIINRGVEPVTANFILKNSSLTIASNTYKLYECAINAGAEAWDMDTYELTITIE